ncbi:SDR family oxidoreductase [Cryptosporangium phraense]|uniref:SDR family NAD(P)-dependent oxidoreductase n=1 Tax=Cryptosporangium phraense TaxID=2593070 RepID=A0A545AXR7_9ACTN|nr:SDR family oxidoreductase [Cryptosporangium phraense]TQS46126.1 SDR family NAD(P)-dependent oxidoreductase [Cryptosporangium phraense]
MVRPLNEQVVVVTGASTGIGRAAAAALAARGARVVVAARGADRLSTLVDDIRSAGGRAVAVPTDVADADAVRALADTAEREFGRIDTWVNNAGVAIWGRIEDITGEEFDRVMRVNYLGSVHGVHAALPALRRAGGGGIIGVASVESIRTVPLQAPYSASKFALLAFYDALRVELAQDGEPISVTTVLPAAIDTPLYDHGRSKLGAWPKPPPPVYAPEIVADAIVAACERPRREVPVGDSALGFYVAQRVSPALADGFMAVRRLARTSQEYERPDNGVDNLDGPLSEPGAVRGTYPGRVLQHSALTRLAARVPRPGELVTSVVRAVHARQVRSAGGRTAGRA